MKLIHHVQSSRIAPVLDTIERPLWSVMIPTYNCADTLERTLKSVLEQDPGSANMQIEVVDDCSTFDHPESVVRRVGGERVSFYRQSRNLGHVGNFNSCIERSRGRLVHILHGDDWIDNRFYSNMQLAFANGGSVGAAFCRSAYVASDGSVIGHTDLEHTEQAVIADWLPRILERQRVCTPSVVVRRDVYEDLGGFDPRFRTAGEDWEMWVRIAARYQVWFEPKVLASYRVSRPGSLTGDARRTTRVVRDMRRACEIIEQRLPLLVEDRLRKERLHSARLFYAGWSLNYAQEIIQTLGILQTLPHLIEAYRCYPTRWMVKRIVRLLSRVPLDPR